MAKRGAPKKPGYLKKEMISLKLPRWLLDQMAHQINEPAFKNTYSRAHMIETALIHYYQMKEPKSQAKHDEYLKAINYKQVDIED